MPSVYNYLSEKLFEITHWKNWSTLRVFGWFAQRICLFCLSACLCQIPVTGAHVLRRELGSSAEPFSTFLSSLNQPLSFSGRAACTWAHMVSGKTSVMALGSTRWQRRWRQRKQENQAEVKERVESWHVDTRAQEVGGNSNRSGFECRNSGDPSAERKRTCCDTTEPTF